MIYVCICVETSTLIDSSTLLFRPRLFISCLTNPQVLFFSESNKIPEETQQEIEAAKKEMENDEDDHEDEINGETDDDRVVVLDLNKEEDRVQHDISRFRGGKL